MSGAGVASELGLTNIQSPCVIPIKKFGLCVSDAGEWGVGKQNDMGCYYSGKALPDSGRECWPGTTRDWDHCCRPPCMGFGRVRVWGATLISSPVPRVAERKKE